MNGTEEMDEVFTLEIAVVSRVVIRFLSHPGGINYGNRRMKVFYFRIENVPGSILCFIQKNVRYFP